MSEFLNHINKLVPIPVSEQASFELLVSKIKIKKGQVFINAGSFSRKVAFVKTGLFRYYYIDKQGHQLTKGFFAEGSILGALSAVLENRASYFTIEALEESEIEVIDYIKFSQLSLNHPVWNEYLIKVLQKAYLAKESREREFLLYDAEERYESFLKRYPGLESRIKQHLIASYLGIAPESLSRLRKKIGH